MRQRDIPLFDKHMELFKNKYWNGELDDYCRNELFENEYIFKDSRRYKNVNCKCSKCNTNFHEDRIGTTHICPVCGVERPVRFSSKGIEKETKKLGIFSRDEDNHLLLEVLTIERKLRYDEDELAYFEYGYTLRLPKKTYCWRWYVNMGWGNFVRYDNSALFEEFKIYNPEEVAKEFPQYDKELFNGYMSFDYMIKNIEEYPATEYLIKSGLYNLASSTIMRKNEKAKSLRELLNVNPNEIPVIKKANVTSTELERLRNIKEYYSLEDIESLRKIGSIPYNLINRIGLKKYINYTNKQMKQGVKGSDVEHLLLDYWQFCLQLNINCSKKTIKYPENIKKAHDRLLKCINEIKRIERLKSEEERQKTLRQRQKIFKTRKKQFERNGLCIIIPETYEEFVIEGSSLNHCVGTGTRYFDKHMNGESLICFIRKSDDMTKPYFTCEIDMEFMMIKQLYGFADMSAPSEIREYVNRFIAYKLKKERKAA